MTTPTLTLDEHQLAAADAGETFQLVVRWPFATKGACPADARIHLEPDGTAELVRDGCRLMTLKPPVQAGQAVVVRHQGNQGRAVRRRRRCASLGAVELNPASDERPIPRSFALWAWEIRLEAAK